MDKRTFLKSTSFLLGASAISPFSCTMENSKLSPTMKNWAGNLTFSAKSYHRPASIEEVQELVSKSKKIKVFWHKTFIQ